MTTHVLTSASSFNSRMKITLSYISATAGVVLFTWLLHEFAHWLTAEFLGYETTMSLNGTSYSAGQNPTEPHQQFISAAGPIVTMVQAFIAFLALKKSWNRYVYLFLLIALYMRVLAGLMNVVNLNDEGRISNYLGIGTFTLSLVVCGLLLFMVFLISKKYRLTRKFQLGSVLLIMLFSSVVILSDQFFGVRLL